MERPVIQQSAQPYQDRNASGATQAIYRDNQNNFYSVGADGQRRKIELPEFQSLGINEKFVPAGSMVSLSKAKTDRETKKLESQCRSNEISTKTKR